MKILNTVKLNVFCKEEENKEKLKEKLISLVPFNMEDEKVKLMEDTAIGFNEKKIKIYEITLEKTRHTNAFLKHLQELLNQKQKELLLRQAESRLDEEYNFFIRLDKEKFLNNEIFITDSGNCFHIKMNIACFPRKRDLALDIVKNVFKYS